MTTERGTPARSPSDDAGARRAESAGPAARLPWRLRVLLKATGHGMPAPVSRVGVQAGLRVPGADGVILLADHYVPLDGGPWPTVLVRSPYGRGFPWSTVYGAQLAGQGFHVLVQSARGTGGSGGELDPGLNEGADGRAAVAWLREQDWFTGVLATIGPSFLGYLQWALAADPPPELRAMVVHNGLHDLHEFMYPGGGLALEAMIAGSTGVLTMDKGFLAFTRAFLRAQRRMRGLVRQVPLRDAYPRLLGRRVPFIDTWLAHPDGADPYWAGRSAPAPAGLPAAVSLVSGWDDYCLDQTLEQYARLVAGGSDVRLLIGPWDHASTMDWPMVMTAAAAFLREQLGGTDGEPTAHLLANGEPFFAWPPVRETLEKTMAEVLRCTKADITINTFALDIERSQFPFVEQIAKVNGGRLFYTDVDDLGSYALDDFVKHRRAS